MPGSLRSSTILIIFAVQLAVAIVPIRSIGATAPEFPQDPVQHFATNVAGYMGTAPARRGRAWCSGDTWVHDFGSGS